MMITHFDKETLDNIQGNGVLQQKRLEAFKRYENLPVPTSRDEEYRRTRPEQFGLGKFTRLDSLMASDDAGSASEWDEDFDVVINVTDTHFSIKPITNALSEGLVKVCSLQDAAEKHEAVIQEHLYWNSKNGQDRKFRELVDAFWNVGFYIHIPKGVELPKGILIRYQHNVENKAILPRVLCIAEDQAKATILEHYQSPDEVPFWVMAHREYYVGKNTDLTVIAFQEWGNKTTQIFEDWAKVDRDGKINLVNLTLGARLSKHMAACDVTAPNSEAYLGGLYFAHGKQHFEQRTLQIHSSPKTYSNMLYKGAAKDQAHSIYQGIIWADQGAVEVDAYQTNNNLLLSNEAKTHSIPGLIINADDLACSHGATIGNLDEEQVYYLRARGIDDTEARKILVMGFFEEVVQRVPYDPIQDRLHDIIEYKLSV